MCLPICIMSARRGARLVEGGEREGALVALGVAVDAAVHEHLVDDDLHRDLREVRGEEVDLARLEPLLALVLLGVGLAAHSGRRLLARPGTQSEAVDTHAALLPCTPLVAAPSRCESHSRPRGPLSIYAPVDEEPVPALELTRAEAHAEQPKGDLWLGLG